MKIRLIKRPPQIATRTQGDDTQHGLGGNRRGAVEKATLDLIERAVATDRNNHLEAITQGGSR